MTTTALNRSTPRFLPSRQTITQSAIYAAAALAILIAGVWAPLRFAYPVLIDAGEVTVDGAGTVIWLVTAMATLIALVVGGVLSITRRKQAAVAPMAGCCAAAIVFGAGSMNLPIW